MRRDLSGKTRCYFKVEAGFTYISVLFLVTVMGLSLMGAGHVWSKMAKREREKELLFRGTQIMNAIGSYYDSSPGFKRYPKKLEDLLDDPRHPTTTRYLRKIYRDPMTGKADWTLVKNKGGSIIGVKSKSDDEVIKKSGFPEELESLEGKRYYREWVFIHKTEEQKAAEERHEELKRLKGAVK